MTWLLGVFSFFRTSSAVTTVTGFLTGKTRLIVEYVMLALLLAVAGGSLALWLQSRQTETVVAELQQQGEDDRRRLGQVELVNQQHEETIKDLKTLRLEDNKALQGVLETLEGIGQKDGEVKEKLTKLEATNEPVKAYLNTEVPLDLQCVLDNTCDPTNAGGKGGDQGGKSNATGATANPVRHTDRK